MILVEDKIILFLFFKINPINSTKLFDYSNKELELIKTAIEESTYIIRKNNKILRVDKQSEIESKKLEILLFHIRKTKNLEYILENPLITKLPINNLDYLDTKIWYVLNSRTNLNEIINDNYFLNKNDIIKFGNIKYSVTEMNINFNENIEKESKLSNNLNKKYDINNINKNTTQIIDFSPQPIEIYEYPSEKNDVICYFCSKNECSKDNPILKFCKCNYLHYECLKNYINKNLKKIQKKNVTNYYINGLNCKNCKYVYPLKFIITEKTFELIEIEKPIKSNYLILESIESKIFYGFIKIIHVIQLNDKDEIITIGRNQNNDIIIPDPSVSREHAEMEFSKKDRKLLLRNKSKKFGSLVLLQKPLKINDNKVQLQIGKIFLETKIMKYGDFEKIKDSNTKNPLPKKY